MTRQGWLLTLALLFAPSLFAAPAGTDVTTCSYDAGGSTSLICPSDPTSGSAVSAGSDVTLTWSDNADDETGYRIRVSTDGGLTFPTVLADIAPNSEAYIAFGQSDGAKTYSVAAYRGADETSPTLANVTVSGGGGPVAGARLGIPDPTWGTTDTKPTPPSPWTVPTAGFYYVDLDTGSDSGNALGTPANPRASIPRPIPAGAYVDLNGTYDLVQGGIIAMEAAGVAGNPAWVDGGNGTRPTVQGAITVAYGSYLNVVDVDFNKTGAYNALQVSSNNPAFPADHIMLDGLNIDGANFLGAGIALAQNSLLSSNNVIIRNVVVENQGPTGDVDADAHCLSGGNNWRTAWVMDSTFRFCSGAGIQVGADPNNIVYASKFYINNNDIHDVLQSGVWCKNCEDMIVTSNRIREVKDRCAVVGGGGTSPSKGIGAQYYPNKLVVADNDIWNVRYGLHIASTTSSHADSIHAVANRFWNLGSGGGACFDPPTYAGADYDNVYSGHAIFINGNANAGSVYNFVNNTIDGATGGLHMRLSGSFTKEFHGNILHDMSNALEHHIFRDNSYGDFTDTIISGGASFVAREGSTEYTTIGAWQTASGTGTNTTSVAPNFTNAAANDYTLQPGSAGENATTLHSVFEWFETTYPGLSIRGDFPAGPTGTTGVNIGAEQ